MTESKKKWDKGRDKDRFRGRGGDGVIGDRDKTKVKFRGDRIRDSGNRPGLGLGCPCGTEL